MAGWENSSGMAGRFQGDVENGPMNGDSCIVVIVAVWQYEGPPRAAGVPGKSTAVIDRERACRGQFRQQ